MKENIIGKNIRLFRVQKELTQRELATLLSVANSTVCNWENGRRQPSISEITRIARFFEVDYNLLIGQSISPNVQPNTQQMKESTQSIDTKPIGMKVSTIELTSISIGLTLVLIGTFTPSNTAFYLFFLGFGFISFPVISYVVKLYALMNNTYRRYHLPPDFDVFYHLDIREKKINKTKKILSSITVLLLLGTLLLMLFNVLIFSSYDSFVGTILIVVIYSIGVMLSFFRYRSINRTDLFKTSIPYFDSRHDLNYPSIVLATLFDLFSFLVFSFILILNPTQSITIDSQVMMTILGGYLVTIGSIIVLIAYQSHLKAYKLKVLVEEEMIAIDDFVKRQ